MSKKFAVVDLGTNTFQLLIASFNSFDGKLIIHENLQRAVQLGKGAMNGYVIQEEAFNRARIALTEFKDLTEKYKTDQVLAVGTSIIRNAKNSPDFIRLIEDEFGFQVFVITGEEEAEYIFKGIYQSLPSHWSDTSLVMDIGGGSVEFILFQSDQIMWRSSFELGGLKLQSLFHVENEFDQSFKPQLIHYIKGHLQELFFQVQRFQPKVLIGAAGAFETIWDLEKASKNMDSSTLNAFQQLDLEIFDHHKRLIEELDYSGRIQLPGMKKFRASIFPYANILIEVVMKELHIKQLYMSNYSLKEGFLSYKVLSKPKT